MASDNFHTQLVGWSKIIFPFCALALLSTLFLFTRSNPDAINLPFADINTLAQELKINAPRFSGMADDGSIIAIMADSAQLGSNNAQNLKISSLSLHVNAVDGSEIRIEAVEGELDSDAKVAYLSGLARLETSTGYTMETNGLTANLQSGVISSEGALEIRAPFGALTAGRVTIETTSDGKGQQMLFTGGVVLIYTSQAATAEDAKE